MAKNIYKVPKKVWNKWSNGAQKVFNYYFKFFNKNQDLIKHPKAEKVSISHWRTISWNSAWVAATTHDVIFITEIVENK